MSFDAILARFATQAPVATMVRAAMANILSPRELDALFHDCRERQYQDTLLFSSVVGLLSLAVTKAQPSLHAAYQSQREEFGVAVAALYLRVAGTELPVTRELVRHTAGRMAAVIEALAVPREPALPGYRTFLLDGSHLAATDHRLKETRRLKGGPLQDSDARATVVQREFLERTTASPVNLRMLAMTRQVHNFPAEEP